MADEDEGERGGGLLKKIIFVILFLILLAGLASYFLLQHEEEKPEILREGPPPIERPVYMDLGTFVVNLKDDKYYLKTSIQLVFSEPRPKVWLEPYAPIVKDIVITQLQTLTAKQLKDPQVRHLLRQDLRFKLNSLFPNVAPWQDPEPIKKVLVSEFYRQ